MASYAILSSDKDYTSFSYGDTTVRFKTSPNLEKYTKINKWDNGYIEVMAKYTTLGEVEEYIDLVPILRNLYISSEEFLEPIKGVEIAYG